MPNKDNFYSGLIKKNLHPLFWNSKLEFNDEVSNQLILIATKFYESLKLNVQIKDIILIGSVANYNWHSESDLDAHIVLDYTDISSDKTLVDNYLELERKEWNNLHDINIVEYPVELSFNDVNDTINSAGKYSLLNGKWLKIPEIENITQHTIDESKNIVTVLSKSIIELETKYKNNEVTSHDAYRQSKRIWKIIKKLRGDFLKIDGEYGPKNLAFKQLRQEGYLDTITNIKTDAHDDIFSIYFIT